MGEPHERRSHPKRIVFHQCFYHTEHRPAHRFIGRYSVICACERQRERIALLMSGTRMGKGLVLSSTFLRMSSEEPATSVRPKGGDSEERLAESRTSKPGLCAGVRAYAPSSIPRAWNIILRVAPSGLARFIQWPIPRGWTSTLQRGLERKDPNPQPGVRPRLKGACGNKRPLAARPIPPHLLRSRAY